MISGNNVIFGSSESLSASFEAGAREGSEKGVIQESSLARLTVGHA